MKQFDIITIFPDAITPYAEASILGKAQEKNLININAHDLRSFSENKHGKVDDTPYGGGAGMVMTVQPFDAALKKIKGARGAKRTIRQLKGQGRTRPSIASSRGGLKTRVILTAASGKRFTQSDAKRLAEYDQVIFLCGRYEGIDARVEQELADESLSIGDFVLTGGELPALVMTDAIARYVPGVLGSAESLDEESHSEEGVLEYPQYTKPEEYILKRGLKKKTLTVPEVLLSGNHKAIEAWRKEQSEKRSA